MHIVYLLHADFELPGIIENWAQKNRFTTAYIRTFDGDSLPSEDTFDMLVILGGPQSALETDKYPYLAEEIVLTKKAIEANKIVLGFCLGAQIIGEAYGAPTEHSPFKEVGVFPISLTEEGKEDPIFTGFPEQFLATHWHNDMPGVPQHAQILASSEGCPRQVIRYEEKVYGFQCHLEVKKENIALMLQHCAEDLYPSGPFVQTREEIKQVNYKEINSYMVKILNNLYFGPPQLEEELQEELSLETLILEEEEE